MKLPDLDETHLIAMVTILGFLGMSGAVFVEYFGPTAPMKACTTACNYQMESYTPQNGCICRK